MFKLNFSPPFTSVYISLLKIFILGFKVTGIILVGTPDLNASLTSGDMGALDTVCGSVDYLMVFINILNWLVDCIDE